MINSDKKGNEKLTEFQKYLIDKKLVAQSKTSYFAYWVKLKGTVLFILRI